MSFAHGGDYDRYQSHTEGGSHDETAASRAGSWTNR
jgi:hypothetical protein